MLPLCQIHCTLNWLQCPFSYARNLTLNPTTFFKRGILNLFKTRLLENVNKKPMPPLQIKFFLKHSFRKFALQNNMKILF